MLEVLIVSVLVFCIVSLSLYKKRYKILVSFVIIEIIILVSTLAYSGSSYRLHVGILGTLLGYLVLFVFFVCLLFVKNNRYTPKAERE
jgi:Ca2+/Na+ antiporter